MTWFVQYDIGPVGGMEKFESEQRARILYGLLFEDAALAGDDAYVEIWEE